jgi:hypothetical protein
MKFQLSFAWLLAKQLLIVILHLKNRYREFLRVARVWKYFQARKRSGQAFGISDYLPACFKDQLAVLCPACPQPGLNMDEDPKPLPVGKRYVIVYR